MQPLPESYDAGEYQQACAVPYRLSAGQPEFCLITAIRTGKWAFPKGFIDPGENATQTALKEAHQEAGLRGRIVGEPLGQYEYAKWGNVLRVVAFLMEVTQCDETWLEGEVRRRCWASAAEARRLLSRPVLQGLLDSAVPRLGAPGKALETPEGS